MPASPPNARIVFIGDTLLGGEGQDTLERFGYGHAFAGMHPLLRDADLVVTNHEGPLTNKAPPAHKADTGRKRYWYRGRPEAAQALVEAGVRVVSLGNNHVLDFGLKGLAETIAVFEAHGVAHCGAGLDEEQARRPALVKVRGRRIGFLSYMQRYDVYVAEGLYARGSRGGCARLSLRAAREDLAALADHVDLRVVLVHWGRNYRPVTPRQQRLAAELVRGGADLVIGHHPHVPQPVAMDQGRLVVYSLGNGALGTPGRFHSGRPAYGLAAAIDLDGGGGLSQVELRLLSVDNAYVRFRPELANDEHAARYLRSLVQAGDGWCEPSPGLLRRRLSGYLATPTKAVLNG